MKKTGHGGNKKLREPLRKNRVTPSAEHFAPLPHSISYYIPLLAGRHIVNFSIYGKSKGVFGSTLPVLQKAGARELMAKRLIDSVWKKDAAIDILNIAADDSLYVLLHGGKTEVEDGVTYFDMIELEPVDGK